jgi:hypothetical protein
MIEMKKHVEPGETPAKITVSMIDQDLKDGISKSEMAVKYSIKPWEVDEMFKHPFLKGRRPSRKKALSFSFVDDVTPDEVEEVDPNQITLHDAIDEAIDSAKEARDEITKAEQSIVDLLGPHTQTPEETIKEAAEWTAKNKHGEEVELDQEDQDTLNEALDTHVNENGETLREAMEANDEDEIEMDDDTFEL